MQEAHLLDLHQIRETWFQAVDVDGQLLEQARCLVLDLPASYDEYVATLGKSLRYDVKKLDRLVASDDSVSIRPVIEETLTEGMDSFFRLHRLRWRKRLQPGAFSAKAEAFHREWSQKALKNGWLWMSTMEVDSLAVGSIYAMRLGDACFFYQAGFDPTAKALSPGTLLVASTIRRSIEKGLKHFDFLRGDRKSVV